MCFKNLAKIWAAKEFVELILILLSQTLKSTHVQKLYMIPLTGVVHLFEVSASFNMCISFQMAEHPIEVGHVLVYFYVKNEPCCTCNVLFIFVNKEHMVYVSM